MGYEKWFKVNRFLNFIQLYESEIINSNQKSIKPLSYLVKEWSTMKNCKKVIGIFAIPITPSETMITFAKQYNLFILARNGDEYDLQQY